MFRGSYNTNQVDSVLYEIKLTSAPALKYCNSDDREGRSNASGVENASPRRGHEQRGMIILVQNSA